MKIVRFGIAMGLLAGLGACSNMMGGSGPSRDTAMAAAPVAPDMVRQVQSKLRDGGYYKQGPVDGVWGVGTESSVRAFQHDHNLNSSGQLDMPTLQALNLASGPATNTTANSSTVNNPNLNNSAPTQPNYNPPPADDTTRPPAQR